MSPPYTGGRSRRIENFNVMYAMSTYSRRNQYDADLVFARLAEKERRESVPQLEVTRHKKRRSNTFNDLVAIMVGASLA